MTRGHKHGPDVRRTVRRQAGDGRGGLACPQCGSTIEMTLDDLLVRHAFACRMPGCGTVLRLDQRGSREAIDTLRTLRTKLREIGSEP